MVASPPTNRTGPLQSFLTMRRALLKSMASAWLEQGADWVSLCDVDNVPLAVWPDAAITTGHTISAPITTARGPVGLWQAGITGDAGAASQRVQAEAQALSSLLGIEDEFEELTVAMIEAQDRLIALYHLNSSLRGQIDLDSIMAILVEKAAKLIGTRAAVLLLEDDSGWRISEYPQNTVDVAGILTAFRNSPLDQETQLNTHEGQLYVIPVHLTSGVAAGIVLVDKPGGFTSPDLKLARAIIDMTGVNMENARLHQESLRQAEIDAQLNLAAEIQRELLPATLPDVPRTNLFGGSVQARQVGGDFYDVHHRPGGLLTFVVGDVTGKGFSSALMMAVTRSAIRSRAELRLDWAEAGAVFTRANHDLYDDYSRVKMFTTAFLGRYDAETGHLCYSNAGHSPVIYCPAGGEARMLLATDMPLGIMPDTVFGDCVITLEPGDVLVVATDGFSEARNAAMQMFGYDALLALVTAHAAEDAQTLGTLLFDTVHRFSDGHRQDDDQTLFVLKRE